MLQQNANHLHAQQGPQLMVGHRVDHFRVVFNTPLSRTQGAQHIGIDGQPVRTIDGEEERFGQKPLLRLLLYAFDGTHSDWMNSMIFL